jgi:MinD-like ATPase involved in chromosome partitioning or flagellar assembly
MPVTYMFQAPRRGPVAQSSPAKAGPGGDRSDAASAPVCLSAAQAVNAVTPEVPPEERGKSPNGLLPDLSQAASASRRRESEAGSQPPMDAAAAGMPTAEARDPEASPAAEAEVKAAPATHQPPVVQTHNLPVKWVPSHSRLILVARSRGGMGATSVAVNLAIELLNRRGLFSSAAHRQVALVDLDVQFGTAGSILDLEDRGGLLALARLIDEPDAQAVRNALLPHPSGLKVLPAPRTAIPLDAFDGVRVGSIIDALMAENDYVVVDLPPALVYWLEPLLKRADRLLMVTDLAVPSVVSARRVIDLMREDNSDLAVDILVSREQKPLFQRKLHRDAARALGEPLGHWLPDETKLSRQALDRGEPLVEMSPRCPWSRAVRKLARQIEASAEAIKTSRKGDR